MADTVSSSVELKINFAFEDGDTRTVSIPNPKESLSSSTIGSLSQTLVTNQFIIGDKTGAALTGISTADRVTTNSTKIDIESA